MEEDSITDSILFVEQKFDLEYLEGLVVDYCFENSSDEQMERPTDAEYPVKKLQWRDYEDPPLSCEYDCPTFYIRECYHIYYDLMLLCLNSDKYDFLTIVGTPGTGKSLFYVYVVHRYRYEHPEATIVTASFNKAQQMIECWIYQPGQKAYECKTIPIIEGALYLYDGPPSIRPKRQKMVCFSCPNHVWLDLYFKDKRHTRLWFPAWTLEELLDANEVCELDLSEETIANRFNFFGGSARYCLSTDEQYVEEGRAKLRSKTSAVDSVYELSLCLKDGPYRDVLSHQIFHLYPEISEKFPFVNAIPSTWACSKEVDTLIRGSILGKSRANYNEMIRLMCEVPELARINGILFEKFVHEVMEKGGIFPMRRLDAEAIVNNTCHIPTGVYERTNTGCESVDGVAVVNDAVMLFQATVARKHPVNAHGICQQLKKIGKFESFINGTVKEVFLIFLIPPKSIDFKKQQIILDPLLNDESNIRDIKRMRYTWRQDLVNENVRTVGDLRNLVNDDKYAPYLEDFDSRNENARHNEKILAIRQYAITLEEYGRAKFPTPRPTKKCLKNLQDENRALNRQVESLKRKLNAQFAASSKMSWTGMPISDQEE
jgi:hypothetical protein